MEKNNSGITEDENKHHNPVMIAQKRPGASAPAAIAVLLFSVVFVAGLVFVVSRKSQDRPQAMVSEAAALPVPSYGYQNPAASLVPGDVPTVVPGKANTKIFRFNVTSPTGRGIVLRQLSFNLAGYFSSLSNFQLFKNGMPVGEGAVFPSDQAAITFRINVPMAGRTTEYFELHADVGTALPPRSAYGYPTPPIFVVLLRGINYSDSVPSNMDGLPLSLSVPISVTAPAQLNAVLAPTTPPLQTVAPGSTKVMTTHIQLSAGPSADVTLDQLSIGANTDAKPEMLSNIRVYDGDLFLAEIPKLTNKDTNGYWGTALFPNKLVIAKGETKVLRIAVNLPTKKTFIFRTGIVGIGYVGVVQFTGQLPLYGNTVTVGEGPLGIAELSVSTGSNTPASRMVFPGDSAVDFSRINLGGDSNQKVVLESLTVALETNAGTSMVKNVRIMAGGIAIATVPTLVKNKEGYFIGTASLKTPLIIPQGATKQLSLYGDIVSPAKKGITLKLGIGALGGSAGSTKFKINGPLPVYGNAMTVGVIRVLR